MEVLDFFTPSSLSFDASEDASLSSQKRRVNSSKMAGASGNNRGVDGSPRSATGGEYRGYRGCRARTPRTPPMTRGITLRYPVRSLSVDFRPRLCGCVP